MACRRFRPTALVNESLPITFRTHAKQLAYAWKFVIPNPFGPWRILASSRIWRALGRPARVAAVRTPDYIRDNIHVSLLE